MLNTGALALRVGPAGMSGLAVGAAVCKRGGAPRRIDGGVPPDVSLLPSPHCSLGPFVFSSQPPSRSRIRARVPPSQPLRASPSWYPAAMDPQGTGQRQWHTRRRWSADVRVPCSVSLLLAAVDCTAPPDPLDCACRSVLPCHEATCAQEGAVCTPQAPPLHKWPDVTQASGCGSGGQGWI